MLFTKVYLRFRQLARSVAARSLSPLESSYIGQVLSPAQIALFKGLPLYEQRHALNVCRTLVRGGYGHDRDLLQAALLHDLGKHDPTTGQTIPIWFKAVSVGLGRQRVARFGRAEKRAGWRYLCWLQTTHEERGASLAAGAGSSSRVVRLVGGYQALQQEGDRDAVVLAWADDLN